MRGSASGWRLFKGTIGAFVHTAGINLLLVGIGSVALSLLIVAPERKRRSGAHMDVRERPSANSGPTSGTNVARPKG